MTTEADLIEINELPLVTKISKGLVNIPDMTVKAAYDHDQAAYDPESNPTIDLEYGDEVYVYENALGATYACFMTAGKFRYFSRITVGVEVIITEEGIY